MFTNIAAVIIHKIHVTMTYELQHDKTNKITSAPMDPPVWSESSLSAWKKKFVSLATYWVHSEDSEQTGRMPRLICVFAACTGHCVGFVMTTNDVTSFDNLFFMESTSNQAILLLMHYSCVTPAPMGPGIAGLKCQVLTSASSPQDQDRLLVKCQSFTRTCDQAISP